jgi:hypothetical protein
MRHLWPRAGHVKDAAENRAAKLLLDVPEHGDTIAAGERGRQD